VLKSYSSRLEFHRFGLLFHNSREGVSGSPALTLTSITVVHRPPDIAPQNNETESRFDNGAFTQGNVSNNFSINPLSISKS